MPVPVSKITGGILGKICGEANEVVFAGMTDLFQVIVCYYVPNLWPLTELEAMFNDTFDNLQENLKPYAYNQGVAMGDRIEGQVEAWIKSKFDAAIADIEALRDEALSKINAAKVKLEGELQALRDQTMGEFNSARNEFEALHSQAMGEINVAKRELLQHTEKIRSLLERVSKLEGAKPNIFGGLFG